MRYFISIVIGIVIVVVVAGLSIVGSPKEERLRRFDDKRVSDMQTLQSHIILYWQSKGDLPKSLNDLEDETRGIYVPSDPQGGTAYEYKVLDKERFELCANFNRKSFSKKNVSPQKRPSPEFSYPSQMMPFEQSWQHGEGRICFDRKIDKDFFKPVKNEEKELRKE